jgi:hypothetical protein
MKLFQVSILLVVLAMSITGAACGSNCTAILQCTNYGCTNKITYVGSDGSTRVVYTIGSGNEAIISDCQSITSVEVVDPDCCLGLIARR